MRIYLSSKSLLSLLVLSYFFLFSGIIPAHAQSSGTGTISASPDYIYSKNSGGSYSTTITWSTQDLPDAAVYTIGHDGTWAIIAAHTPSASLLIDWIDDYQGYTFYLFPTSGTNTQPVGNYIATAFTKGVTNANANIVAYGNPCSIPVGQTTCAIEICTNMNGLYQGQQIDTRASGNTPTYHGYLNDLIFSTFNADSCGWTTEDKSQTAAAWQGADPLTWRLTDHDTGVQIGNTIQTQGIPTYARTVTANLFQDTNYNGSKDAGEQGVDSTYQTQYQTEWYYDYNKNNVNNYPSVYQEYPWTDQASCTAYLPYWGAPSGSTCKTTQVAVGQTLTSNYLTDSVTDSSSGTYTGSSIAFTGGTSQSYFTTLGNQSNVLQLVGIPAGFKATTPTTQTVTVNKYNQNPVTVNFGIAPLPVSPWYQTQSGDIRADPWTPNPIPSAAVCTNQPYMSLAGSTNTPGVIVSGTGDPNFGTSGGKASAFNWQIGGTAYPETFTPIHRTSVSYIQKSLRQLGIGTIELSDTSSGVSTTCIKSGTAYLSCKLTGLTGGASPTNPKVYIATGDLNLTADTLNFTTGSYIILVTGTLTLNGEIHITKGNASLTVVAGNISIAPSIGANPTSCTPAANLEGFYSSDTDITVQSTSDCTTNTSDKQLTVEGALVANARQTNGNIKNSRDLCSNNSSYPSLVVRERPDFSLTTPLALLQNASFFKEVAP